MSLGSKYVFFPWFRKGISTNLTDQNETNAQRAKVFVDISAKAYMYNSLRNTLSIQNTPIELYGPGDVLGFDSKVIIRIDPQDDTGNFEPNYFPMIEFSEPDFPWRYTPTAPSKDIQNNGTRLVPWICLIVLKSKEGEEEFEHKTPKDKKPFIIIEKNEKGIIPLPHLEESWAWAHVQLTSPANTVQEEDKITEDYLQTVLTHTPGRVFSRLLCPRKLEPQMNYQAFVVPAFKTGLLAGLGYVQELSQTGLLEPAWKLNQDSVVLPYYYTWTFHTGKRGDFEYLIRLLEPQPLDKRVGTRSLNCASPGYQIPSVYVENPIEGDESSTLRIEGALMAVDAEQSTWDTPDNFQKGLVNLLNIPLYLEEGIIENGTPVIVPPIYGQWHAARRGIDIDNPNPQWLNQLNLDPRNRVIASLGTKIIQEQQDKFIEAAWNQIGALNEVNQLLRQAQLACAGSERIFEKMTKGLSTEDFITTTNTLHGHIPITIKNPGKVTLEHLTRQSVIPTGVFSSSFKRINRPRGPIRKGQVPQGKIEDKGFIERINLGEIASREKSFTTGIPSFRDITESTRPEYAKGQSWQILKMIPKISNVSALLLFLLFVINGGNNLGIIPLSIPPFLSLLSILWIPLVLVDPVLKLFTLDGHIIDKLLEEEKTVKFSSKIKQSSEIKTIYKNKNPDNKDLTNHSNPKIRNNPGGNKNTESMKNNKPLSSFKLSEKKNNPGSKNKVQENDIESQNNSEELFIEEYQMDSGENFGEFAQEIMTRFLDDPAEETPVVPIPIDEVSISLADALNPNNTILERLKAQVKFEDDLTLEPVMATPQFIEPMYTYIRNMDQDLLFPGLEFVPSNSISLLKSNQKFIEAFMVGLSHEMARELLWREFPTDQRGTNFRKFWEYAEFIPSPEKRVELKEEARSITKKEWGRKWKKLSEQEQHLLVEKEYHSLLQSELNDIKNIHRWNDSELGNNSSSQMISQNYTREGNLVLLIRGEILKKFPRAVIYAVKGTWEGENRGEPQLNDPEMFKTPIFRGTLKPDVTFLGFDLTAIEAKGKEKKENDEDNPGWYFVIEERVSETRFGVDIDIEDEELLDLNSWNDLTWSHIQQKNLLFPTDYIILYDREKNTTEPLIPDLQKVNSQNQSESIPAIWGLHSAHLGRIFAQRPFRVAIHADDMLPVEED